MFWKRFIIFIGILIILAFIVQLMAAPYLKVFIIKKAKQSLRIDVSVGNCTLNVLKGRITLEDVVVPHPRYKEDYLFKAKEISADFYLLPLLFNKQIVKSFSLTDPEVILYLDDKGVLQVPQFDSSAEKKSAKPVKPEILLGRLIINNGNLRFIDQHVSKPATVTTFSGINCDINNSASIINRSVSTTIEATGRIEGQGKFSVIGKGDFVSKPMSFNGEVKIEDVPLPKFTPYYGDNLSIVVKRGDLNVYSKPSCDKGNLYVKADVRVDNVDLEPIGDPTQTILFELKTSDVIEFLKDENNAVNFSFEIKGDLNKPDFKWGPEVHRALKQAMMSTLAGGIANLLKQPAKAGQKIGEMIGGEAGETVKKIGNDLQKILGK